MNLLDKLKLGIFGVVIFAVIMAFFGPVYTVDEGERAVLLTFGKAGDESINPGLHFKWPFIQSAVKFDIRTQKYEADASAASKDLQMVKSNIAVIYHLKAEMVPEIYGTLGRSYGDKVIQPQLQEVLKAVTAKYSADQLITNRSQVAISVQDLLKARLLPYGIIVESTAITNFDFSDSFNNAIEAKVTAQQQKQKAEMDLQRIQIETEQAVTKAKGEAEALKVQREAVTSELLELRKVEVQRLAVEKWDGKLPTYTGANGVPMIGISV